MRHVLADKASSLCHIRIALLTMSEYKAKDVSTKPYSGEWLPGWLEAGSRLLFADLRNASNGFMQQARSPVHQACDRGEGAVEEGRIRATS